MFGKTLKINITLYVVIFIQQNTIYCAFMAFFRTKKRHRTKKNFSYSTKYAINCLHI